MASEEAMEADRSKLREVNNLVVKNSVKLLAANLKVTLPIILLSLIACSLKPLALSIPVDPLILQSLAMPFATYTTITDYMYFPRSDYSVRAALALTISHLAFFLPIVTTIQYVSLRCSKEQAATAKELASGIIGSSAASFFTRLCVTLLDLVSKFPLLALAKVAVLPHFPMGFFAAVLFGIALTFVPLLRSVWLLALVVSAAESRWGVSAVKRALELVHRNKRQTFGLAFSFFFIGESFVLLLVPFGGQAGKIITFEVVTVVLVAVLGVVSLAAHVFLYYYYLNNRCGDDQAAAAKDYSVLPADDPRSGIHA